MLAAREFQALFFSCAPCTCLQAMRHSRITVFTGAAGALAIMTVLSVVLGVAAPALVCGLLAHLNYRAGVLWAQDALADAMLAPCLQISKTYTHYAATILFFFFGSKSLWDAYHSEGVRTLLSSLISRRISYWPVPA